MAMDTIQSEHLRDLNARLRGQQPEVLVSVLNALLFSWKRSASDQHRALSSDVVPYGLETAHCLMEMCMGHTRASQHIPTRLEELSSHPIEPVHADSSSSAGAGKQPLGPLCSASNSDVDNDADWQRCISTSSVLPQHHRTNRYSETNSKAAGYPRTRTSIVRELEQAVEADPTSKDLASWDVSPSDLHPEDADLIVEAGVPQGRSHVSAKSVAATSSDVPPADIRRATSASPPPSEIFVSPSKPSFLVNTMHVISSAAAHARAFSGTATTTQGEHSTQVESASRYPLASPVRSLSQLDGISKKSVVRSRRLYQRWATASRKAIFGKRTLREKMELQALQHSCHRSMESNDKHLLLRLILDDPLGGEDLKSELPAWYNLDPTSTLRIRWDILTTTFLVYLFLVLPLRLAFNLHAVGWLYWLENVVVPCVFGIDIVLNCITGVYITVDDEFTTGLGLGNLRRCQYLSFRFRSIMFVYLRGWLAIDLVSTFPWEMMEAVGAWGSNSAMSVVPRMLKLMRLSRLLRLVRFLKIHKQFTKTIKSYIPNDALQLLQMACTVCMIAHYTSCGWYYVAHSERHEPTWLEDYYSSSDQPTVAQLYLTSMYWSFATIASVGYGDVVAVSKGEKIYAILVMYLGIAVVSVMTSRLTTILSEFNARDASISRDLAMVQSYCDYRNLPPKLRATVLDYFELRITQRRLCNEEMVLRELSPALKAQVMSVTFRHVIESVPFFKGCGGHFLSAVLCSMEPFLYAPGDIIIQKGQRELAMFMLQKGKAGVTNAYGEMVKELHTGDYFGEIALFFGVRRTATVYAVTFCDVFRLSKECFESVQARYPDAKEIIINQAEEMFNKSALCFVCGEKGHISAQCTKGEDPFLGHEIEMDNRERSGTNDSHPESDDTLKHMTVGSSSHLHGQAEVQSNVANLSDDCVQSVQISRLSDTAKNANVVSKVDCGANQHDTHRE